MQGAAASGHDREESTFHWQLRMYVPLKKGPLTCDLLEGLNTSYTTIINEWLQVRILIASLKSATLPKNLPCDSLPIVTGNGHIPPAFLTIETSQCKDY